MQLSSNRITNIEHDSRFIQRVCVVFDVVEMTISNETVIRRYCAIDYYNSVVFFFFFTRFVRLFFARCVRFVSDPGPG